MAEKIQNKKIDLARTKSSTQSKTTSGQDRQDEGLREEDPIILEQEQEVEASAGHRHKKRTPAEQKALLARLKRVEGQIRGIERMVENDAYCPDILIQVSAATSALNSFNKVLLQCHIRGCVAQDIREGNDEVIDELCGVLQKLMK